MKVRIKPVEYSSSLYSVEYKEKWWHFWSNIGYLDIQKYSIYYGNKQDARQAAESFIKNFNTIKYERQEHNKRVAKHNKQSTEYING